MTYLAAENDLTWRENHPTVFTVIALSVWQTTFSLFAKLKTNQNSQNISKICACLSTLQKFFQTSNFIYRRQIIDLFDCCKWRTGEKQLSAKINIAVKSWHYQYDNIKQYVMDTVYRFMIRIRSSW